MSPSASVPGADGNPHRAPCDRPLARSTPPAWSWGPDLDRLGAAYACPIISDHFGKGQPPSKNPPLACLPAAVGTPKSTVLPPRLSR